MPWPAFLQARFNIPPDGRSLDELIAYDCRWRSREPCTCLPDAGILPPCVEFPWFYTDPSTTPTTDTATPIAPQPSPDPIRQPTEVFSTEAKTGDG